MQILSKGYWILKYKYEPNFTTRLPSSTRYCDYILRDLFQKNNLHQSAIFVD